MSIITKLERLAQESPYDYVKIWNEDLSKLLAVARAAEAALTSIYPPEYYVPLRNALAALEKTE